MFLDAVTVRTQETDGLQVLYDVYTALNANRPSGWQSYFGTFEVAKMYTISGKLPMFPWGVFAAFAISFVIQK